MAERIVIDNQAANHIQAYLEYEHLVGGYDNGKLMSEKEYETFKKNLAEKQANRLYVSWQNSKGNECKYVGPATKCFCGHRFKEHDYLKTTDKKINCRVKGCKCPCFSYIPAYGSYDFKCMCKHSYTVHDPVTKRCVQGKCAGCHNGFQSTWSCGCGLKYNDHKTIIQTKDERIKSGKLKSIEDQYTTPGGVPLGIGSIQKFGDIADYEDGYQKQIKDMQNGHKPMHAIYQANEQLQITGAEDNKRKQKLNDLNKRLKQEKQIDQLDQLQNEHFQSQQMQQYQMQKQQQTYMSQNHQVQSLSQSNQSSQQNQMTQYEEVKGRVSALELFNTPHQFTRVTVKPRMIKKY